MTRVLVLGATGMLGSAVYGVLQGKYDITVTSRDAKKLSRLRLSPTDRVLEFDAEKMFHEYQTKQDGYLRDFISSVGTVDYVINCVGVIIPFALKNPALTFFVNSALPHILAREYGSKLIHITTDCVYAGVDGLAPYDEESRLSPVDIYGLSKSLGEPTNCLTLRTSIAGPELNSHDSLLGWFLHNSTPGSVLSGYTDCMWNGITTQQFGVVCDKIMTHQVKRTGIYHVFSEEISKYDTLLAFKKRFGTLGEINPVESGKPTNRTLSTIHDLNKWLKVPTFPQMVEEMVCRDLEP